MSNSVNLSLKLRENMSQKKKLESIKFSFNISVVLPDVIEYFTPLSRKNVSSHFKIIKFER